MFRHEAFANLYEWIRENPHQMKKFAAAGVCAGGMVADYAITGQSNTQKWIARGAYIWTAGELVDLWRTCIFENMLDAGSRIKAYGAFLRAAGSTGLGLTADNLGFHPYYTPGSIGVHLAGVATGEYGIRIKNRESPRHRIARKYSALARLLRNEKGRKVKRHQLTEMNIFADSALVQFRKAETRDDVEE